MSTYLSPEDLKTLRLSLQTLANMGIVGAKEALIRNASVHDSAVILRSVNPPDRSSDFETLLRSVHQRELRRTGDIELLLVSLGSRQDRVAKLARKRHVSTLRYTVMNDRHKVHRLTFWVGVATALLFGLFAASRVLLRLPQAPTLLSMATHAVLHVVLRVSWVILCVGTSLTIFLTCASIVRLLYVAALWSFPGLSPSHAFYVAVAAVLFAGIVSMTLVTGVARPFLFVTISAAVVFTG